MKHKPAPPEEGTQAQVLATDFLSRLAAGERPATAPYLEKLIALEARQEFRRLLENAGVDLPNAPRGLQPGERVGPYRIREQIGSGGMGMVFRATDTELGRDVAIKILPPHKSGGGLYQQHFREECRIPAQLQHPGIVTVHEVRILPDLRMLVMDLVDGLSLEELIRGLQGREEEVLTGKDVEKALGRPLKEGRESLFDPRSFDRTMVRIMREIVRAIEAAHGKGVIHRDLKPSNVMITGGGHPVVLDFGLAGSINEQDSTGEELRGTLPYLAPEQVRDSRIGANPHSDIYQLGLIFYEMLTLQKAFEGGSIAELCGHIRNGDFPWPRKVRRSLHRDLEAICLKALDIEAVWRYSSARAMGDDLDRFLEGRPTIARPPGLLRRGSFFVRRNRLPVVGGIMLGIGLWIGVSQLGENWNLHMQPFRIARGATQPARLMAGGKILEGDILGVEVENSTSTVIYALAVMGTRPERPDFVLPVAPELSSQFANPPEGSRARWALKVPSGRQPVFCSLITSKSASPGEPWYEGLWLFTARDSHGWMDAWLEGLARLAEENPAGIPLARALARLRRSLGPSRGQPIQNLDALQRAAILECLQSLEVAGPTKWSLAEPRLEVFFPFQADFQG
ncbi:MAG: serine/threonine-protein kinase [Planctomycetota bacterium]